LFKKTHTKKSIKTLFAALCIVFISCEDETPTNNFEGIEFISIETDQSDYYFDIDNGIFNTYFIGENQDQLALVLDNPDSLSCQLYISDSKLLSSPFPITVPTESSNAGIQIRDLTADVEPAFGPDDDFNYSGNTFFDGVKITIDRYYTNGWVTGSFSGKVETETGKEIKISRGIFQVMINIQEGQ